MTAQSIQGPKGHWLLGNLKQLRAENVQFFLNLYRQYGSKAKFRMGPADILFVADHELVYRILVKESDHFIKGDRFWQDLDELIGQGILRIEGGPWKRKRKLYAPSFHPKAIEHYCQAMSSLSQKYVSQVKDNSVVDLHEDMLLLTADIVCQCLFDRLPSEDGLNLAQQFDDISDELLIRRMQLLKLPHWVPTRGNRRIQQLTREIEQVVLAYLDEALEEAEPNNTLLSLLVHSTDEDGERLSRQELRDEIMTLFLAGHETTALSVSWALYELSRNPDILKRMQTEVDDVMGDQPFQFEHAMQLPYANAVFNESLRLYPPAASIPRQVNKAGFEVDGEELPKGSFVLVSPFAMHRNETFFPEPDAFKPERWLDDLEKQLPKSAYIPFGAGSRVCIGNRFAQLEGLAILTTLVQNLNIEQATPYTRLPKQQITLRLDGDLPLKLTKRQKES